MTIEGTGGRVLEINSNAITQGEIKTRTVTKTDGSTLQTLATDDFSLSADDLVPWANYASGDLQIGGSNTDGVDDIDITFTGFLKLIGGADFSI